MRYNRSTKHLFPRKEGQINDEEIRAKALEIAVLMLGPKPDMSLESIRKDYLALSKTVEQYITEKPPLLPILSYHPFFPSSPPSLRSYERFRPRQLLRLRQSFL